jgi:DNA helicase II / ATP-dependent DNA helicase PcrA
VETPDAAPPAARWWRAAGPWSASLEGPGAEPWRPAWTALLAGGEPTMPVDEPGAADRAVAASGWRPPRRRRVRVPSVEAALAWARERLEGAPLGWTVALRADAGERVRWRARGVDDVRAAARELAGWQGDPPGRSAPTARAAGTSPAPALTAAQRAVVEHDGGPAVVVAVAGAGKTTTMVARIRHRVAAGRSDPRHLLVVSFSRAAIAAVRKQLGADPALADIDVRTFHSLAHALLAAWTRIGGPPPAAGPPPDAVVAQVMRRAQREAGRLDPDLAQAWRTVDAAAFAAYRGRCLARLELPGLEAAPLPSSARAETRPPPPDPDHPDHPALLEAFERVRRTLGWLDHDQRLVAAWAALHASPALLAWARERWRAAIVDEAQDVNAVQLATLERLMAGRDEVMLVGDDDQSVYGFRGAVPGSLRGFAERRGARVLLLPDAFRSRAEPLAAAATLMAHGGGRWPVRPRAARGPGGRLTLDTADGPDGEANALLARCLAHHAGDAPWGAQAVLLRRFAQLPPLELEAARRRVPLRIEGAPPLERHPAVVAAWAGVALALGGDDLPPAVRERAWRRWLAGPGGMPQPAAWAASARVAAHAGPGADAWREAAPRGADPEVGGRLARLAELAREDAAATLLAAGTDPRRWPADPPAPLSASAALLRERSHGTEPPLPAAAALAAWRAAWRRPPPRDAVLVTSVHRAKGLEWPVVHVPGMAAGSFPLGADPEERRLAYVAWTRAREALHLYRDGLVPASLFLAEGEVKAICALARDHAWLAARPGDHATLAGAWYRREASSRFGAADRG